LIVLCLFCSIAFGQDSKLVLAEKLFVALGTESQIEAMAHNMDAMQRRQLASVKNIPKEAKPFIEKKMSEMIQLLFSAIKKPEIRKRYIDSFASTYSEQELKDIVSFFESKAGRIYVKKSPQLQKNQFEIAQITVESIKPEKQRIWREIGSEIEKYSK